MILENIKDKLPSMFTELRDIVNRTELIARSGNVQETCLLLTELIQGACDFQTLLLRHDHEEKPVNKAEESQPSKLITLSQLVKGLEDRELPHDTFSLSAAIDANGFSVFLKYNGFDNTTAFTASRFKSDVEKELMKIRSGRPLLNNHDPVIFLSKHTNDSQFESVYPINNVDRFLEWIVDGSNFYQETLEAKSEGTQPSNQDSDKQVPMTFMDLTKVGFKDVFDQTGTFFYPFRAIVHNDVILFVLLKEAGHKRVTHTILGFNEMVVNMEETSFSKPVYLAGPGYIHGNEHDKTETKPLMNIQQFANWLLIE